MVRSISVYILLCTFFTGCKRSEPPVALPPFTGQPTIVVINQAPEEISGLADSKGTPGTIWAHEDSGTPAQLIQLSHTGNVVRRIPIRNVMNRDWEDMASAGSDLYIGDIGDNALAASEYVIYKFAEPGAAVDTIRTVEAIRFRYPDGAHDAEALWVDPQTRDIYVITKRDAAARVYKITAPYAAGLQIASLVGSLNYTTVTGAALSPDAKELIVKTYGALYHYKGNTVSMLLDALINNRYQQLNYVMEPQGEAVCFAQNNSGFFTASEKGFGSDVKLYYYKRN